MYRIILALALIALAAACGRGIDEGAAGVTTSSATSTTTTTLVVVEDDDDVPASDIVLWADPAYGEQAQAAVAAFTTATGIGARVELKTLDEIAAGIRSGVGPDIFMGDHTWLGSLARTGLAAPLPLDARTAEFLAPAIAGFTEAGAIRGVPFGVETIALFFNPTVTGESPGAFSAIRDQCLAPAPGEEEEDTTTTTEQTTTTAEGEEEPPPEPAGPGCVLVDSDDALTVLSILSTFGGYLFGEPEGEVDAADVGLTGDGALAGATFIREQVIDGVMEGVADPAEMAARLASGEALYLIGGADLAAELSAQGVVFEAAALPIIQGNNPVPYVIANGFMVAGRSAQIDTATLLLTDFLAVPGTMEALAAAGAVPAYTASEEVVGGDQVRSAFLESARTGRAVPPGPGIDETLAAVGAALSQLFETSPEIDEVLAAAAAAL